MNSCYSTTNFDSPTKVLGKGLQNTKICTSRVTSIIIGNIIIIGDNHYIEK